MVDVWPAKCIRTLTNAQSDRRAAMTGLWPLVRKRGAANQDVF
jgi:hypothetical protein